MALCGREFPDGHVCRERAPVIDTRLIRDDQGRAVQRRVIKCPICGLMEQDVFARGPTEKKYVPSDNSER